MKKPLAILLALTCAFAVAQQDSFVIARKWAVGQKENYRMTMNMEGAMSMSMQMTMSNEVKKVYENGDADVEMSMAEMTVKMGDQEHKMPQGQKPTTIKYNKFGTPVSSGRQGSMDANMMALTNLALAGKVLKVGQTYAIDETDKESGTVTKGTVRVESLTDGVGKLVSDLNILMKGQTTPMNVKATTWVSVGGGQMQKIHGTATGIPAQGGMAIDKMTFTMELIK